MKVIASRNARGTLPVENTRMERNCGIPYWSFNFGRNCLFFQKEIAKNRDADKNIYRRRNDFKVCTARQEIYG